VARNPRVEDVASGRLAAAGPGRFELTGTVGFEDAARLLSDGDAAFGSLPAVEVDLARVTRADSAGLALLIEWSLAAREAGRTIRYSNVPPAVVSLAAIGDVTELLGLPSGG
jgi:phospholipid transport system transporter-binding protein